jgi:hypothetical protein
MSWISILSKTGMVYAVSMNKVAVSLCAIALILPALAPAQAAKSSDNPWTFAVSGDSRNCGDFVMPVIAARVKAEGDLFYWHLGDFRAIYQLDQDLVSMLPAGTKLTKEQYQAIAWDDFVARQLAPFGDFPVFLGRGNHETIPPMTREAYEGKFAAYLNRPEIAEQNTKDAAGAAPKSSPWFHVVRAGIDFITLDNAAKTEFSDAQLAWLRGVLDRDLAAGSGVTTIVAGMHEALPHSTSSSHAMDDWPLGIKSGEQAYKWFADAQTAGKHVYLIASHSHFYSSAIYDTPFWQQAGMVVPGVIIGSAGAHRYLLPKTASKDSKTHIYGYLQATVHSDGTIDFSLLEVSEAEMIASKWPEAPLSAVYECYVHNSD